ncbi:MAG: hypothetical protein ISS48_00905 [Candidatus Aenigmarchaeota archaeon]|nr:hypothetical protein [Candidatus Aenigmarchaeota archaeon]
MNNIDESVLIKFLDNSPKMRILDFFLGNKLFDFTKKEIVEELGMSYTTFYKVWGEFEKFGVVKVNRRIGKAKLCKLDRKSPIVQDILKLERKLINQYVDMSCGIKKTSEEKIRAKTPIPI